MKSLARGLSAVPTGISNRLWAVVPPSLRRVAIPEEASGGAIRPVEGTQASSMLETKVLAYPSGMSGNLNNREGGPLGGSPSARCLTRRRRRRGRTPVKARWATVPAPPLRRPSLWLPPPLPVAAAANCCRRGGIYGGGILPCLLPNRDLDQPEDVRLRRFAPRQVGGG